MRKKSYICLIKLRQYALKLDLHTAFSTLSASLISKHSRVGRSAEVMEIQDQTLYAHHPFSLNGWVPGYCLYSCNS